MRRMRGGVVTETLRLRGRDIVGVGSIGLRTRRARAILTAVGIAIGIAAMVAVLGISASSRADLLAELDRLGTNLLEVRPGQSFFGQDAKLPQDAARDDPPRRAGARGIGRRPRERDRPAERLHLAARDRRDQRGRGRAEPAAHVAGHRALGDVPERRDRSVSHRRARRRVGRVLGVTSVRGAPRVLLGGQWFTVIGILDPFPLAPSLDRAALDRVSRGRSDVRDRRFGVDRVRAHHARPGRRGAECAPRDREPAVRQRGGGRPPVGRARGARPPPTTR